jgi:TrmH family RNA methyltransferase
MGESPLARVRVVLHETQNLFNVAATLRAMKNMGVPTLRLVRPALFDVRRIQGIAHDTMDLVEGIRVHDRVAAAVSDCVLTAAFTARHRSAKWTLITPREAASRLVAAAREGPVAIVFGREDRGLPNEVLDQAQLHITIPTTAHASLNLAHAVIVGLYELHLAAGDATRPTRPPRKDTPPPAADDLERYFADVERSLDEIDFFKTRYREHVMRTVRSLALRSQPNARELSLMRAMAIEIVNKLERERRGRAPARDDVPE